ncbi:cytochrome c oxidase assembly protein COX11, mitochondrial [Sipha flava]|uniref:Cytochrome c oxidase assembly protein COX11, mitochondrial n=1 Tax=Sipha flava TaxID=143950 RepID=A0A2S2QL66_9HEMI|nr:cytochrome c oxidase assembly protein COX11, mitochondrial [Sipha flava]XP_025411456.1 cytochrome c oxidase assembly protein COX11, mitochondrial [Sipha flava]
MFIRIFKLRPLCAWQYVKSHLHTKHSHSTNSNDEQKKRIRSTVYYLSSMGVLTVGLSYAAVPLYKMFCQAFSYGGTLSHNVDDYKVETMKPVRNREIKVHFTADTSSSMQWSFKPLQTEIRVAPGETALAFYTAKNPLDKPVTGISTYNVVPFEAGQYFNKIQCFCFEEQQLNPNEEVDMPVFFFIDPEYTTDPKMENINDITLSYTFFEAKQGVELPNIFNKH